MDHVRTMSTPAEIDKMTTSERLQAIESLWDSLVRQAESVPSPGWHGEILTQRLERVRRGETNFLPIEEVKRRLRR
jgi:putative addiction module component (TIGR02574 family)